MAMLLPPCVAPFSALYILGHNVVHSKHVRLLPNIKEGGKHDMG